METSGFAETINLAVARTDIWYALWLVFLLISIAVTYWSRSHRGDNRNAVVLAVAFVTVCTVVGAWLNVVFTQMAALHEYAGAMVTLAGAIASTREPVELGIERIDQAGVVDSIEPPALAIWLCAYFGVIAAVLIVVWVSSRRKVAQPSDKPMHATCEDARA